MRVRRLFLPILASLAAATAAGCGSDGPRAGIPEARAESLRREIKDVREAVEGGRCDDISGQLAQVDERVDNLPSSVDDGLRQSLTDGVDRLRATAGEDCTQQGLQDEGATSDPDLEPPADTETDTTEPDATDTEPPPDTPTQSEPSPDTPTDTGQTEPPVEIPPDPGQTEPAPAPDDSGGNNGNGNDSGGNNGNGGSNGGEEKG